MLCHNCYSLRNIVCTKRYNFFILSLMTRSFFVPSKHELLIIQVTGLITVLMIIVKYLVDNPNKTKVTSIYRYINLAKPLKNTVSDG